MRTYSVTMWVFVIAALSSAFLASSRPCSPDLQVSWVVDNSARASELARAANCSGGAFDVEWIGHVELPETIYIVDGTVMNITGAGSGDVANGANSTQFLNVVNAALRVSGLRIQNCSTLDSGGAIYAEASTMHFNETTWSHNTAGYDGGAIAVYNSSDVSWSGETSFSRNSAGVDGGALYAHKSDVTWTGGTIFSGNFAGLDGGGMKVNGSDVSWFGATIFSNNTADDDGGALYAYLSTVSWNGETSFARNNASGDDGGALALYYSNVSWNGETSFSGNNAVSGESMGGALFAWESDVSWSAETSFSGNSAGYSGGALAVWYSNIFWSRETSFSGNIAYFFNPRTGDSFVTKGGALYVTAQSSVSWSGETSFSGNAGRNGGALLVEEECPLCIEEQSKVSWSGNTSFSGNSAEVGGALFVFRGNMLWSAETTFSGNTAKLHAGALHLRDSTLFWSGKTNFSENSAGTEAGAVTASSSYSSSDQVCNLSWSGETSFVGNTAGTDGGALHVELESYVSWSGETIFSGNTAYRSGGAIALIENSLSPGTVAFVGNTAGVSGGALYMSTVVVGPKFVMANFTSNTASQGGVVYSASSGTSVESGIPYPTTYERCNIFENRASSSGGAIESVAGIDWIVNTTFTGNLAGVGGALRLGGNTELDGCTFIDNVSDENEGAAISNVGTLELDGNRTRFSGNVFWCEVGTFVDMINATTANVTRFEKVCHGCGECDACGMEDENSVPICTAAIKNTRSEGGDTSIETLKLDRGFWRATNSSRIVLACYKEEACVGGISGTSSFCLPGYEGPYCSVCSGGYSKSLAFTCTKCVDDRGSMAIMVVVGVFVLAAAVAFCVYLVSGEVEGALRRIVHRVIKRLPFQSIKIVVVVWQILTQFSSVANVTYPDVYQRFLDGVNILNFDVLWIPSAGCLVDVDFHGRLLVSTIGPLVALALLAITYTVAKRRSSGSEAALQRIRHKHMSAVLLMTFLVYSSVSATVFQTFACEDLDDRKTYLTADYRIECDSSEHQAFQVFAGIMILVYPVGIPLFYGYLLYKNRRALKSRDEGKREASARVQSFYDLWAPYKPGRFYYEVIECGRRMSLTGAVVFIYPNTAAQVAVTLVIAFSFVVVSERLAPYVSKWDASISLMGHVIVFTSMYTALLSKVDVSDERANSQEVFAGVLVAAHACMVVAVIVETVVMVFSMRRTEGGPVSNNGPRPRVYRKGSVPPLDNAVLS